MSSTPTPVPPAGDIVVHVFGRTDVGRTREHNEDAFVVADLTTDNDTLQPEVRTHAVGEKGTLFMVADGMGGAAAGEIASAMAVEIVLGELRSSWLSDPSQNAEFFVQAIKSATKTANEQINSYAAAHPEYRGMGTTATIAGLLGDTLYLAQVGDSRAYLVRNGVARQITKDQSLMQKLIEAGELTEEEAERSERRNIILQALGPDTSVKIELTHQTVRRDDTLVLCSDGLSGQVTKDEIGVIVSAEHDLRAACQRLIDLANAAGGPDNITVIVARFEGAGLQPATMDDEVGHRLFPLQDTRAMMAVPLPLPPLLPLPLPDESEVESSPPADSNAGQPRATLRRPALPTPDHSLMEVPEPAAPDVSPVRRGTGMLIAAALLVALIIGAVWFLMRTARTVAPPASAGAAAGGPAAKP